MRKVICIITTIMCILLVGCSIPKYTEQDCNSAKDTAYQEGYDEGHEDGYSEGYDQGKEDGYDEGKEDGFAEDLSSPDNYEGNTYSVGQPGASSVYVTPSGSKYHQSWCRYVANKTNLSYYNSASEAEAAGYDACSVCF